MGLEILEGWDPYADANINAQVGNKWTFLDGNGGTVTPSNPRTGRACLTATQSVGSVRPITLPTTRLICGWAAQFGSFATAGGGAPGIFLGGNYFGVKPAQTTGNVSLIRNGAVLAASGVFASTGVYNYYLMDIDFVGLTCDVYFDRTKVINAAPFTSLGVTNPSALVGYLYSGGSSLDDYMLWVDPSPGERAALIAAADFAVKYAYPSADGATQDWSFTGGASAWESINNEPVNTAQYIEAAAAADVSQFDYANISTGVYQVYGAQHYYYAQKTTAGSSNVQAEIEGGAGADNPMATSWAYYTDIYETNPGTASPWAPGDLATLNGQFERTV